jgi:hypothetical protein
MQRAVAVVLAMVAATAFGCSRASDKSAGEFGETGMLSLYSNGGADVRLDVTDEGRTQSLNLRTASSASSRAGERTLRRGWAVGLVLLVFGSGHDE